MVPNVRPIHFGLNVSVLAGCIEIGTGLARIQVVMTQYQGLGIAPAQLSEQPSHGSLLLWSTRVGGLPADVEPSLVADADGVGVVVHAVGTY